MFTREKKRCEVKGVVGWDMNMFSMDGFWKKGYVNISLRELYSIHITYHNKRRKVQRLAKTKPRYAKKLLKKISERERNRTRDMIHKLTAEIAKKYRGYVHVLENLEKENMYSRSRKHNRSIALHDWRKIVSTLKYKAEIAEIDPRNTTRTCSRCGSTDTVVKNGTVTCRRCGLRINRQLNAAINIYLKGNSLRSSPETWSRLIEPRLRM